MRAFVAIAILSVASVANAQTFQWNGFALLRGASDVEEGPLAHEQLSSQVQVGLDWWPNPRFGIHAHLLGRTDTEGERSAAGIAEAFAELNLEPANDRVRLRAGAMFLLTSRENIDALWENPYAISSSALNSWLGEEFRPIGIDVSYFRRRAFAGATLFRGNDTFGALPAVRGWALGDHWTLLGERVPVDDEDVTSVSAENDGRLGWLARGGWNGDRLFVQLAHVDNRSDGLDYGRLFNWGTRFTIAGAEYTRGDWTFAAENGWGPTFLIVNGRRFTDDIQAGYALASRQWPRFRATVRIDSFKVDDEHDQAITVAYFWTGIRSVRLGAEVSRSGDSNRVLIEARYKF